MRIRSVVQAGVLGAAAFVLASVALTALGAEFLLPLAVLLVPLGAGALDVRLGATDGESPSRGAAVAPGAIAGALSLAIALFVGVTLALLGVGNSFIDFREASEALMLVVPAVMLIGLGAGLGGVGALIYRPRAVPPRLVDAVTETPPTHVPSGPRPPRVGERKGPYTRLVGVWEGHAARRRCVRAGFRQEAVARTAWLEEWRFETPRDDLTASSTTWSAHAADGCEIAAIVTRDE